MFITPTGPPNKYIAGENYSLQCSAGGVVATLQWQLLGPPDGRTLVITNTSSIKTSSNSTTSHLLFTPLRQSHNGSYVCVATSDDLEGTLLSEPMEISVNGSYSYNYYHHVYKL